MRLIDADALLKELTKTKREVNCHLPDIVKLFKALRDWIKDAPTIDALPVKHGRWHDSDFVPGMLSCSICGAQRNPNFKIGGGRWDYCPNCGAKMDGERS